jgi:hypothetical protein
MSAGRRLPELNACTRLGAKMGFLVDCCE